VSATGPAEAIGTRTAALLAGLGGVPRATRDGLPSFVVPVAGLRAAFEALRAAGFAQNTLVTAVDLHPLEPRYEVVWQFLQHAPFERVRLYSAVRSDAARVPSCCDLWPGASFSERECYDMFGIDFEGHPDLRRLLMPEGYEHFPLRKDFPHQGLEPDRLYRQWDRERRRSWEATRESRT
jgi:NADH-quinone oxidoreductase subunit C